MILLDKNSRSDIAIFAGKGELHAILIMTLCLSNVITVQGFTALNVIVLLSSEMQLIIPCIIREYLWHNFDVTRQKSTLIVDKILESTTDE